MSFWLVAVILFLVVAIISALLLVRGRRFPAALPTPVLPAADSRADETRRQAVQVQGSELLERRVELDSRRGTLTGDQQVFDALVEVQNRFQRGEISESEYEAEKVRLLGG